MFFNMVILTYFNFLGDFGDKLYIIVKGKVGVRVPIKLQA